MAADPFALPTGGFAGEATITDAAFKLDERFTDDDGNMQCLLSLTLDPGDGEHDAFEKLYTCGPGWEPADGGAKMVRADDPDNDNAQPNGNTKIGRLINAVVKLCPDVIRDRYADGDGLGATDAAMFEGLRFIWADEVKKYKFTKDGQKLEGESSLLLPAEFVSVVGGGAKAAKAPAKKAPAKKKAAAKKAPAKSEETIDPTAPPAEIMDAAWAAYEACEGFDDFIEAVLQIDGIEPYVAYATDAADEGDTLWNAMVARAEG